jgi:hypothetical protein
MAEEPILRPRPAYIGPERGPAIRPNESGQIVVRAGGVKLISRWDNGSARRSPAPGHCLAALCAIPWSAASNRFRIVLLAQLATVGLAALIGRRIAVAIRQRHHAISEACRRWCICKRTTQNRPARSHCPAPRRPFSVREFEPRSSKHDAHASGTALLSAGLVPHDIINHIPQVCTRMPSLGGTSD